MFNLLIMHCIQPLDTIGAVDLEYFEMNGRHYLAVANSYDGANSRLDSVIYRWEYSKFIPFQYIEVRGLLLFSISYIQKCLVLRTNPNLIRNSIRSSNVEECNVRKIALCKVQLRSATCYDSDFEHPRTDEVRSMRHYIYPLFVNVWFYLCDATFHFTDSGGARLGIFLDWEQTFSRCSKLLRLSREILFHKFDDLSTVGKRKSI